MPVELADGRHAFEVTRDHSLLDSQLHDVRRTVMLLVAAALFGAALVFWLVGGRALVRSHRIALRRASATGSPTCPTSAHSRTTSTRASRRPRATATRWRSSLLDLDDFKFLNDRHGHPHGDAICGASPTSCATGRAGDRAYRIGGDEFALLLPHTDAEGARAVGRAPRAALERGAASRRASASARLRPGHDRETLRAEADAALYEAKRHGGGTSVALRRHPRPRSPSRAPTGPTRCTGCSTRATSRRPSSRSGTCAAARCSASRPDPPRRRSTALDGPAEAFDVAEQIGRVHATSTCSACAARSASAPELPPGALLFLNLAPQTLDLGADGDDWLPRAVARAGLRARSASSSRSPSASAGATAPVLKSLRRLREQGFKLALDDVGTGNAGLEMLREVGAEFVKLDRSIVAAAPDERQRPRRPHGDGDVRPPDRRLRHRRGHRGRRALDWVRTIDDTIPREAAMVQGGQGYGLGRPSAAIPAAGATLAPAQPQPVA